MSKKIISLTLSVLLIASMIVAFGASAFAVELMEYDVLMGNLESFDEAEQERIIAEFAELVGQAEATYEAMAQYGEISEDIKQIENMEIVGYAGSTAEAYANDNGFAFTVIEEQNEIPDTDTETDEGTGNSVLDKMAGFLGRILGEETVARIISLFEKILSVFQSLIP